MDYPKDYNWVAPFTPMFKDNVPDWLEILQGQALRKVEQDSGLRDLTLVRTVVIWEFQELSGFYREDDPNFPTWATRELGHAWFTFRGWEQE